jgi:hypothetical protein
MKKQQVDHVLRSAGRITGEKQFVIVGSQALHGKFPDLPDEIVRSAEVDLIAKKNVARTDWLNAIGQDSSFHEQFGYYADPVDENTATLPRGWRGRLVNLPPGDTEGVTGLCLDPHDLAIAKYAASGTSGNPGMRNPCKSRVLATVYAAECVLDKGAHDLPSSTATAAPPI